MEDVFWKMFADHSVTLETALVDRDVDVFSELTDELAECLVAIEPRLNLNIGGPDPFRLAILPLPGAEELAQAFVANGTVPGGWEVAVGLPEFDPIESVVVQDEAGDSLSVKYAELAAKVLPPQQGRVTIVVSLNREIDGSDALAHLYQAVAENVVFNILGGWPPELEKAVLLPRSQTGTLPSLDQLRQQWIDVVDPTGNPPG